MSIDQKNGMGMPKTPKQEGVGWSPEKEIEGKTPKQVIEHIGGETRDMKDRLSELEKASPEEKKQITKEWLEETKEKDEYFAKRVEEDSDDLDNKIDQAIKDGKLKQFLFNLEVSIGPGFDDYTILGSPLEQAVEQYAKYARLIKKLIKIRDENGISPSECLGFLSQEVPYLGRKLKEKLDFQPGYNPGWKNKWRDEIDKILEQ